MPQVSKNPIDKKTKQQIFDNFYGLVSKLIVKENIARVLGGLFTKTERIMIAKRIAAVILLSHGCSTRHISLTLKMSSATITKLKNEFEKGDKGLEEVARIFREDKKSNKVVEHLARILEEIIGFVPPQKYDMRSRWRSLHG